MYTVLSLTTIITFLKQLAFEVLKYCNLLLKEKWPSYTNYKQPQISKRLQNELFQKDYTPFVR